MNTLSESREYAARCALRASQQDLDLTKQLAESKYRSITGRELSSSEIKDLHNLVIELKDWTVGASALSYSLTPRQAAGF